MVNGQNQRSDRRQSDVILPAGKCSDIARNKGRNNNQGKILIKRNVTHVGLLCSTTSLNKAGRQIYVNQIEPDV